MSNRIYELRLQQGLSYAALGEKVGTTASQIQRLERGERRLTVDWMIRLGQALGVDPKDIMDLQTEVKPVKQPILHETKGEATPARTIDFGRRDLPVYASTEGGNGHGAMILDQSPVEWIVRPDFLQGVKDAYAIYLTGDSMEPRYEHGDLILVAPGRPIRNGRDVVIVHRHDGNQFSLLKRLVRITVDEVVLKQYNPEKEFSLQRQGIVMMHAVVGRLDER